MSLWKWVILIVILVGVIFAGWQIYRGYEFASPLTDKATAQKNAEKINAFFDPVSTTSLSNKIEYVAKYGGKETVNPDFAGNWVIDSDDNSIQFTFFSKVTLIALDAGWVPINSPYTAPIGAIGEDASAVFAKADTTDEGYSITYKTWFRELDESPEKGHKIELEANGKTSSSNVKSITIEKGDVFSSTVDGKTLIITKIKISLVE